LRSPDVILAFQSQATLALQAADQHRADRVRRTSPIPSRPALSTVWRGRRQYHWFFTLFEYCISAKWLELLKTMHPA